MNKPLYRKTLLTGILASLLVAQVANGQNQVPNDLESKITVKISVDKKQFRPGANVVLHVEIWNDGTKILFIFKEFQGADNALSALRLSLYYNGHVDGPSILTVADSFNSGLANSPSAPPMANVLSAGWIALEPRHFYGGEAIMSAWSFKRLQIPGRYRVQGKYTSRGFLAQDINNPLLGYSDELEKLPYKSWVGEVDTNSVWIEVVGPRIKKSEKARR